MITITVDRIGEHDEQTYGVLRIGRRPRFVTCEDIWRENQREVSCIPCGEYLCVEYDSPRFGRTYLVDGVPDRSGILFHPGNNHVDTRGCILVGSSFASESGASGITNSRSAFTSFLRLLKNEKQFELVIRNLSKD